MQMLDSILATCQPGTRLCIAVNLTGKNEMIASRSIQEWKNKMPAIHKQPAVFLIYK
jgi:16S rRNA (cytidine1402-2'-O)-methyltransferase